MPRVLSDGGNSSVVISSQVYPGLCQADKQIKQRALEEYIRENSNNGLGGTFLDRTLKAAGEQNQTNRIA